MTNKLKKMTRKKKSNKHQLFSKKKKTTKKMTSNVQFYSHAVISYTSTKPILHYFSGMEDGQDGFYPVTLT